MIHGGWRADYAELRRRARRLASALGRRGVRPGDTVALMLPNTPAMLDAHYGIPMAGAVINALNIRLEAETIAYILDHGEAKVLLTDPEFAGVIGQALARCAAEFPPFELEDGHGFACWNPHPAGRLPIQGRLMSHRSRDGHSSSVQRYTILCFRPWMHLSSR